MEYEIVAPCYEEAVSLHTDYTSPEYLAFEKKLYEKTLRKLGFGKLLPEAVSYTHLDVYKRQPIRNSRRLDCGTPKCLLLSTVHST